MPIPLLGMLGAAALSGGMGMLSADQQNKTNRSNMEWSEEAQNRLADRQMDRQLQMWKKTGIAGQRAELEKAGMNAALLYGGGGSGGQSQSVGGATPSAPQGSGAANPQLENSVGMAMQVANLKLIDAQTKKAEAEATKISGADTDETNAGAALKLSQKELNEVNTKIAGIEADIKGRTSNQAVEIINKEMGILTEDLKIRAAESKLAPEQAAAQLELAQNNAKLLAIKTLSEDAGIQVSKAQAESILAGIDQKWKELGIQAGKAGAEHGDRIKAMKNELVKAGIYVTGQVVGDLVKLFTKIPTGQKSHTTYENTDGSTSTTWFK